MTEAGLHYTPHTSGVLLSGSLYSAADEAIQANVLMTTTSNACLGSKVPVHSLGALRSSATVSRNWKVHRNPHDRRGNEQSVVPLFTFQTGILFVFFFVP